MPSSSSLVNYGLLITGLAGRGLGLPAAAASTNQTEAAASTNQTEDDVSMDGRYANYQVAVTLNNQSVGDVGEAGRYAGYQVLAVTPTSEDQIVWLAGFRANFSSLHPASEDSFCHIDWWNELSLPQVTVSLAVAPACATAILQQLRENGGLDVQVTIADLSEVIRQERNYRFLSQLYREPNDWNPEVYHSLHEIRSRLAYLVGRYTDLLSTRVLATTHEGRSIEAIVVREPGKVTKPVIWIDCGIHAREWVSPPTCIHIIERLVESVNSVDPQVRSYNK